MAYKQYDNFDCRALEHEYYGALLALGITPDLIHPEEDLSAYKVVIAPNLMLVSQKTAENIERYVANGGCVVFGVRTGIKNDNNVIVDTPWPGLLHTVCGVAIEEFEAFPDHIHNTVKWDGKDYDALWWADIMRVTTAQVDAVYNERFYKGTPAVSVNNFGTGKAVYFGVAGCYKLILAYLHRLLPELGVTTIDMPEHVFITRRTGGTNCFTFLINMGEREQAVDLPFDGVDCLSGVKTGGQTVIKPLEVMIIQSRAGAVL